MCRLLVDAQRVVAVNIGDGTARGTHGFHGSTDEGLALLIDHVAFDGYFLGLCCHSHQ